ncbi:SDR family NAD(P)-dependent oxidoreductase [Algibacter lectus]|uniref:SDR family NAD(P)-dependent oxidoreductase n=1 Tax=Algibacter lectus TaxID=221126 RepID=UPI0034E38775
MNLPKTKIKNYEKTSYYWWQQRYWPSIINTLKDTYSIVNISRTAIETSSTITQHTLDVLEDELPEIDSIDALVYCPGSINLKALSRLELDDFKNDFNINVLGAIKTIKHYEKALIEGRGSVVLFSSVATQMGMLFTLVLQQVKRL